MKKEFNPYERVLIQKEPLGLWIPTLYSYYDQRKRKHVTMAGIVSDNGIKKYEEPK